MFTSYISRETSIMDLPTDVIRIITQQYKFTFIDELHWYSTNKTFLYHVKEKRDETLIKLKYISRDLQNYDQNAGWENNADPNLDVNMSRFLSYQYAGEDCYYIPIYHTLKLKFRIDLENMDEYLEILDNNNLYNYKGHKIPGWKYINRTQSILTISFILTNIPSVFTFDKLQLGWYNVHTYLTFSVIKDIISHFETLVRKT